MRSILVLVLVLGLALAGCAKRTQTPEVCPEVSIDYVETVLGSGAPLQARFHTCADAPMSLVDHCGRSIDIAIRTALAAYPVAGPVANQTTPCSGTGSVLVSGGDTKVYDVPWEGTYHDGACDCDKVLPKGRYSLIAHAVDADTGKAYQATNFLVVK